MLIESIILEGLTSLCKAANILVELESSFCFNKRTNKRMDLVININSKDFLIDATIIDPNNPSNGSVLGSDHISLELPLLIRLGQSSTSSKS